MTINKPLLHFKTYNEFNKELQSGNILNNSLVFIQDTKQIYTHGTFYDASSLLITLQDNQESSDNTAYSSLKSDDTFLKKNEKDIASFLITFLQGIVTGKYQENNSGGKIDQNGNIEGNNQTLRGTLKVNQESTMTDITSDNYSEISGYKLTKSNSFGHSKLEVDELYVRLKAYFDSLEIKKVSYMGGTFIISPAGSSIQKVVKIMSSSLQDSNNDYIYDSNGDILLDSTEDPYIFFYRCFLNLDDGQTSVTNEFKIGDLVLCKTFNIKSGVYENVSNTYYWRRVIDGGESFDYIDLSDADKDLSSTEPKDGDTIVTLGNINDTLRQNAIILSSYGEDAPYIIQYSGIDSYSLENKDKIMISPSKNKFTGQFIFSSGKDVETSLQEAVDNSSKANENAQNALEQAQEAKNRLDQWAEDGVISPNEKQSIKDEIKRIDSDKEYVNYCHTKYEMGTPVTYNNAYNAYREDLVSLSQDSPEVITIPEDFEETQSSYYSTKVMVLNAIAEASKNYVNQTVNSESEVLKQYINGQITATNESFETKYTTITEYVNGQVETLQSSIEQNSGEIKLATTNLNSLQKQVSEIQITTDNIEIKVGSLYPDNIFPDGDFRHNTLANIESKNIGYIKNQDAKYNEETLKTLYLETKQGDSYIFMGKGQIPIKEKKKYTIIFSAYSLNKFSDEYEETSMTGVCISNNKECTLDYFYPIKPSFEGWQTYSIIVESPENSNYMFLRFGTHNQPDQRLYITDIMIFEGEQTTIPKEFIPGENDKLLATGIDVENKKITVTSNTFEVKNNKGETTATVDENGTLTANIINEYFKVVNIDNYSVRGIIFKNAFNCYISPTILEPYIFLPNDSYLQGRTLQISYSYPGAEAYPIYLLNSEKECKFYYSNTSKAIKEDKNYCLKLSSGALVTLIAVPANEDLSLINWYILSPQSSSNIGYEIITTITESVWQDYKDSLTEGSYITI